ncbi:MAG: hypothetical protein AVDCRST_MAG77-4139 [uncultured Chloroflexi bacterium]|uniref:Beta-lactamase-related domain-containing protein n=1 Tax=uncultured Chloroflexota bacterium TaxID=166587 RepID=A0A6J4JPR5_9CHLR|nr:MAG: hypothetical protein AVDCRST_MAG77-4139 [uncultured Chloroflexota bacterium]
MTATLPKTSTNGTASAAGHLTTTSGAAPLPHAAPESLGLDPARLDRLYRVIEGHIAGGHYPGAQVAIARHGKLAAFRTFGRARIATNSAPVVPATDDTLWLLYSQSKMVTAAAVWQLVDDGALSFADRISDHVPEFSRHGKREITVFQLLTHQGGFPSARPGPDVWGVEPRDRDLLRQTVCDFTLEWTPGSRIVYHPAAAHWVAAVLIETLTGLDYRQAIRERLLDPAGIRDVFLGVPASEQARCAHMCHVEDGRMAVNPESNSPRFYGAGIPGGGGFATAAGMAAFYQMLLAGGTLNGVRVLSPRVIQYATRNHTGDRTNPEGQPMNRGMTPAVRGYSPTMRGAGTIASPSTFGHGGAGSSYSWGDPESGLSFTYLSNARLDGDPATVDWHNRRLDQVSSLLHSALVEP